MEKNSAGSIKNDGRMVLPWVLRRYMHADLVTVYKARFVFYVCLLSIVCSAAALVSSAYLQINDPATLRFNYPALLVESAAIILFLVILGLLLKGYYSVASNMLILTGLASVWLVMLMSQTYAVSNLDTVVYILVILSMTPILVRRRSWLILFYTLVNIPVLWIYMYTQNDVLGLTATPFYDYLSDVTISLVGVSIITWNIFIINSGALHRLENDIEHREKAEADLRQSRSELSSLLRFQNEMVESLILWVVTVDVDGNIITWNRAAETITGYSKEEAIGGSSIWNLIYPDESYRRMVFSETGGVEDAGGRVENFETVIVRKDGTQRIVSWHSNRIYDENGKIAGNIGIGADITDRRHEQEEKEKLEEQILQMQKMESIGRLAGGIAHDFNNLLTAILGTTEMALLSDEDDGHRESFQVIQRAAESASNLTRQLLSFSRKQVIEPKILDINEVIDHISSMLSRMIGDNIVLKPLLADDLCTVKADPGQIEQILVNLAVNARDAMPEGGAITLQTGMVNIDREYCRHNAGAEPGEYVMIAVSDTGHGIDKDVKDHIFEPFFTTKKTGKGTGLGLATVYGAVRQSGGFITFYSEEGQGAVFRVYLPCAAGEADAGPDEDQEADFPEGNETILIVEDNEYVLQLAVNILSRLGYKVLQAASGEDAVKVSRNYCDKIDLMLTDVILTGMNGKELAKIMSGKRPEMKVLFTSGYTGELISRSGILDEGINFIGKPYSAYSLAQTIRNIIDGE